MSKQNIQNKLQDLTNRMKLKNLELNQAQSEDSKKLFRNEILIIQNQIALERIRLKILGLRDSRPS